ncbi:MAG: hypothetical protein EXQ52_08005 [Bryobacterales bacterium]|nr:hypothetical protein [Bryobacterales bacterium]
MTRRALLCTALLATTLIAPAVRAQETHATPAAEHAQGEHKPEKDLTIWKWANFAILAGLLGYMIAKNAPAFFASRTATIQKGIAEARKISEEAMARASAIERKISALDSEVASMRAQSKAEAEAEGQRVREDTERELAKINANGQREIESAGKTAREELKLHAANLALGLARERIGQRMTPENQNALVESFVRNLPREN